MRDQLQVERFSLFCDRALTIAKQDSDLNLLRIARDMGFPLSVQNSSLRLKEATENLNRKRYIKAAIQLGSILENDPNNATAWVYWSRSMLALWLVKKKAPYLKAASLGVDLAIHLQRNNEDALVLKTAINSANDKPGRKSMIIALLILVSLFALIGSLGWIFDQMTSRPHTINSLQSQKGPEEVKQNQRSIDLTLSAQASDNWTIEQGSALVALAYNSNQKNTTLHIRGLLTNKSNTECHFLRLSFTAVDDLNNPIDSVEKMVISAQHAPVSPQQQAVIGFSHFSSNQSLDQASRILIDVKEKRCSAPSPKGQVLPFSVDLLPIKPEGVDFSFFQRQFQSSSDSHIGLHQYESIIECNNSGVEPIKRLMFKIEYLDKLGNRLEQSKALVLIDEKDPPLLASKSRYHRIKKTFSEVPIEKIKLIILSLE